MPVDEKKTKQPSQMNAEGKRPYVQPDFAEESVFETLAAGCTFEYQANPTCNPNLGGVVAST